MFTGRVRALSTLRSVALTRLAEHGGAVTLVESARLKEPINQAFEAWAAYQDRATPYLAAPSRTVVPHANGVLLGDRVAHAYDAIVFYKDTSE